MKKRTLFLCVFVLLIGGYFYNQNFKSKDINFERFNIVSPGIIRTPDERFKNLEDYNFKPNYIEIIDKLLNPILGKSLSLYFKKEI